jgi:signal transduction histidine kinase
MREIGLRAEILFNFLILTAASMLLFGFISFKITEAFALRSKIEATRSVIKSFEVMYAGEKDLGKAARFLSEALGSDSWGFILRDGERVSWGVDGEYAKEGLADPSATQALSTGGSVVEIEGFNFLPLSDYKGFKVVHPLKDGRRTVGLVYVHGKVNSLKSSILAGQKYIAFWIIADLLAIGLFGSYILSKRIVKPVEELTRATRNIASGKPPAAKNKGWVREINSLYDSLCRMHGEIEISKEKLKENIRALEEKSEELVKMQQELIASEKLASTGILAAGVAHEIGNPLSAIRGYVELLKRGYAQDREKAVEFLGNIQHEVDRIDAIIRTLLEYSRPKTPDTREINPNTVASDVASIVRTQGVLKGVRLELELSDETPDIRIDPNQLAQVLMNLILNARDAIGREGTITITTRRLPEGGAEIQVRDTGCGIPKEHIHKIFDPFFTTKEPGKGTGLGLAVSLRIVKESSGTITVESEEGKGTVFKMVFPEASKHAT